MNRILVAGKVGVDKVRLVQQVFSINDRDLAEDVSQSGLIVDDVPIATKYYKTSVCIFVDEFESAEEWFNELYTPEAKILREEIQGLIICIDLQTTSYEEIEKIEQYLQRLATQLDDEYTEDCGEPQWDGFKLVVGFEPQEAEEFYYDMFIMSGFEYITYDQERIRESVQTHRWRFLQERKKASKSSKTAVDYTQPLLDHGNEKSLDVLQLVEKMKLARIDASRLPEDQKHDFAQTISEKILDYLENGEI
ncbi:hypothetical protein KL921_002636 [Ogataea angusta]|uniref:Increased recombination centers protein 6 n=1 Tax=Pichia angusta TaxID=870730 RepID=A0AAN6DGR6_PICAN|nr:uncharacterized protein KL928_001651 [Ogataea angusta]KAG7811008.1 hypothetical protein KL921_002636 [Ogataea angusta]KAG7820214.1 hypothetical protein KL928_001651 [Ogataea angusta]KAG7823897.1 hypothetical protein KL909_002634 [Ogataea angusta]KAG7829587.1 hypothetical protein KL920_002446 [Ogataea angusta]KAG7838450.1 hypothetical protein KL943_000526 [Ogataea angusta]